MAGRSIDYTANLDAEDNLSKAAEKAADALDDLESRGDVEIKFRGDTAKVEADVQSVLDLVDRVGGEAGALVLTSNATQMTSEIGDLVLELNELDASDPQIDIKVENIQALEAGLGTISTKAKEVIDSTGGMGSAMSNAFGNAAQDLAGLAGITGSAGQAIGQLGDQFITAASGAGGLKAAMAGVGAAAGPIAAIAAVVGLVTSIMGEYQAAAEASAERTKAFGEAMADSGNDALGFADVLRDNEAGLRDFAAAANSNLGDFGIAMEKTFQKIPGLGLLVDETSTDVVAAMSKAGLSIYDFGTALDDNIGGMAGFISKLQEAKNSGAITGEEFRALKEAATEMNGEVQKAAETQGLFNVNAKEANDILQDTKDPLTQNSEAWATLEADMADGTITTEAAAQAMNLLADKTGLSREQVADLAQSDIDKKMEETARATEEAAKAAEKLAEAQMAYNTALSSADWQMSQIEGAVTAYTALGEQQFGLANIASNTQAAYDSLNDSIKENGFTFDNTTEKGRANGEQIQNLYSSLIPQLSAAFADAGGSVETFGGNMDALRSGVFEQLSQQTTLTADEINAVIDQLGVFDGTTYSSTFELLAIEDANTKLALLSGMLSSLPPDVQRQVMIDVLAGDPYAALGHIEEAVGAPGAGGMVEIPIVPGEDTATPAAQAISATDWTTSIAIGGDPAGGKAAVAEVDDTAAKTKPLIDIGANIEAALVTMYIINAIARAMAPVVTVGANTFPAIGAAAAATQLISSMHATVRVNAQLASYPSAAEIANRIGVVRVPIDAYIRTMPRVTGAVP